ncbi:unnamed protein product [Rhodiola kirilowii]
MASGKDMLFVIPAPGFGHLGSILEMVKKLNRPDDNRFSITFLIISFPFCNESELVKKLSSSNPDFNFVDIPLSNSAPEVIWKNHQFAPNANSNHPYTPNQTQITNLPHFLTIPVSREPELLIPVYLLPELYKNGDVAEI